HGLALAGLDRERAASARAAARTPGPSGGAAGAGGGAARLRPARVAPATRTLGDADAGGAARSVRARGPERGARAVRLVRERRGDGVRAPGAADGARLVVVEPGAVRPPRERAERVLCSDPGVAASGERRAERR